MPRDTAAAMFAACDNLLLYHVSALRAKLQSLEFRLGFKIRVSGFRILDQGLESLGLGVEEC